MWWRKLEPAVALCPKESRTAGLSLAMPVLFVLATPVKSVCLPRHGRRKVRSDRESSAVLLTTMRSKRPLPSKQCPGGRAIGSPGGLRSTQQPAVGHYSQKSAFTTSGCTLLRERQLRNSKWNCVTPPAASPALLVAAQSGFGYANKQRSASVTVLPVGCCSRLEVKWSRSPLM